MTSPAGREFLLPSFLSPPSAILAGGRARRLGGGDKPLTRLGESTILDHLIARLRPQVRSIVLNAGGDPSRFARFGLDVIADGMPDQLGPLAGILASLEDTARRAPDASHVLTVPCDTPFLPLDLASRLAAAAGPDAIAVAASDGRLHHVTALWPVALAGALRAAMSVEGSRRVEAFAARHNLVAVSFDGPDPFFNVNTPADLLVAEARAGAAQSVMAEGGIMGRSGSRDETKD